MQRPRSAVLMSVPFTFSSRAEAVRIKQRVKECFSQQNSLSTTFLTNSTYEDGGPSLLKSCTSLYSPVFRLGKSRLRPCLSGSYRKFPLRQKQTEDVQAKMAVLDRTIEESNKQNNEACKRIFQLLNQGANSYKLRKGRLSSRLWLVK